MYKGRLGMKEDDTTVGKREIKREKEREESEERRKRANEA